MGYKWIDYDEFKALEVWQKKKESKILPKWVIYMLYNHNNELKQNKETDVIDVILYN